ncbi:cell division cycle 37-like 1 S homeolog isoform X2 [Xenopus laevis]|uniref:Hsp90 co-chaperone Cdc37-like 1 n=1 Tax=Xenopus laevis TaxID=8355 RepID=A0A8J0U6A9_XENLA|nr:cell division cycle 37-like 1 S homeolog isoform X2 [Xenopus laevis]
MAFSNSQQNECGRSSVACKWSLAEAQQKLNSLALHNSESIDQEQAMVQAELLELKRSEEEWKRKEAALSPGENRGLSTSDGLNQDVFNKVKKTREDEDQSASFIQKYEAKMQHFGMLSRWNDSQRFLSECPDLVSEETAKYLLLWCYHLESEQKTALMEQVAHQAVVMQFIIEMAKSCNVDPRGCFRLFFQKAKEEKEGYFEAFKSELEILKSKVRQHTESQRYQAFPPDLGHMGAQQCHQQDVLQGHLNAGVCHLNPMEHAEDEDFKMMDTL